MGDILSTNLEEIKSLSQRLLSRWNDFIGELESTQIDMNQPIIQIGKSLKEVSETVNARLVYCSIIAAKDKKSELLIYSGHLSSALSQLQNIETYLDQLSSHINSAKQNEGIQRFDASNGYISTPPQLS